MMDDIRRAIKDALHDNPAGLGATAIAVRMGVSKSWLYRYCEAEADEQIPLQRLLQLVLVTGDIRPLQALCRLAGGTFVPLPAERVARQEDQDALVKAVKEFAELVSEVAGDLLDGRITRKELARIEREGEDALHATVRLIEFARLRNGRQ